MLLCTKKIALGWSVGLLFSLMLFVISAAAEVTVAVLDFELKDLTLAPQALHNPAEVKRTASIRALLEINLRDAGYGTVNIDQQIQKQANKGFGYLFQHNDVAADLGKQFSADYILVGRLHKPSFLFAYIMGRLIRVSDAALVGEYIYETKGGIANKQLTRRTVATLASGIDQTFDKLNVTSSVSQ